MKSSVVTYKLAMENPLETAYLFHHLFIAIQRFNAVCVVGCFGEQQKYFCTFLILIFKVSGIALTLLVLF